MKLEWSNEGDNDEDDKVEDKDVNVIPFGMSFTIFSYNPGNLVAASV